LLLPRRSCGPSGFLFPCRFLCPRRGGKAFSFLGSSEVSKKKPELQTGGTAEGMPAGGAEPVAAGITCGPL